MRGCDWVVDSADMPLKSDDKKMAGVFPRSLRGISDNSRLLLTLVIPGKPEATSGCNWNSNAQVWLLKVSQASSSREGELADQRRSRQCSSLCVKPAAVAIALKVKQRLKESQCKVL